MEQGTDHLYDSLIMQTSAWVLSRADVFVRIIFDTDKKKDTAEAASFCEANSLLQLSNRSVEASVISCIRILSVRISVELIHNGDFLTDDVLMAPRHIASLGDNDLEVVIKDRLCIFNGDVTVVVNDITGLIALVFAGNVHCIVRIREECFLLVTLDRKSVV